MPKRRDIAWSREVKTKGRVEKTSFLNDLEAHSGWWFFEKGNEKSGKHKNDKKNDYKEDDFKHGGLPRSRT